MNLLLLMFILISIIGGLGLLVLNNVSLNWNWPKSKNRPLIWEKSSLSEDSFIWIDEIRYWYFKLDKLGNLYLIQNSFTFKCDQLYDRGTGEYFTTKDAEEYVEKYCKENVWN